MLSKISTGRLASVGASPVVLRIREIILDV